MGRRRSYIGVLAGRAGETQDQQSAIPAPATPLPPGFPGASALVAAGYTTLESLRGLSEADLIAIKGVGPKLAKQILQALGSE
jgi:predicted flap endonuclease-1-like 5' DNA nuclease